eukprot:RCo044982
MARSAASKAETLGPLLCCDLCPVPRPLPASPLYRLFMSSRACSAGAGAASSAQKFRLGRGILKEPAALATECLELFTVLRASEREAFRTGLARCKVFIYLFLPLATSLLLLP